MIRVGTRRGTTNPAFPGFAPVVVLTKSSAYGSLGPYVLRDEAGRIFENVWQFSKLYDEVPRTVQRKSRWDPTVVWDHPHEVHVRDGQLTPEYYAWRRKGMACSHAVRYPVGFSRAARAACRGAITDAMLADERKELELLDYVDARKAIYLPEYCRLARAQPQFRRLQARRARGENLLIIEVDGPIQADLPYYQERYGVADTFIEAHTIEATRANLTIMLNDTKHPFGHGYCLAAALLGYELA